MADEEGEESLVDQATEWVEETFGSEEAPAEEGPISVPYEEPTEEEKERLRQQSELSDLISSVCGQLKNEVAAVQQVASYTTAESTRDEMSALASQCSGLSSKGYSAASQLTAAGVQDWVYSVKACNEVGFWANSAAGHASAASTSEYDTEIRSSLDSVVNELANAAHGINGA